MTKQKNTSSQWSIILFTIGVFMAGLDNGIISTALSTISDEFTVSPSWGAWSITIYTLGVAVSVPIIGKLSDNYGRKRLFIIEVFLFGLGSLLVALSPNFIFLLAARFIQAIGGGGIFIIGSAHVLSTMPKEKQGKALGLLGSMHGLSAIIGPNLGAIILNLTGSWHWMFLINLPIAGLLIIFGLTKMVESKQYSAKRLDYIGISLLTLGILSFMYGITLLDMNDFINSLLVPKHGLLILTGLLSFIFFIIYERNLEEKGRDPIISYGLMTKRLFQMTLVIGFLSGGFLAGIIFIPSYVQQVLHIPVEHAGFWVTPLALCSGIGAGLGGFMTDRFGAIKTIVISGLLGIIGFSLFAFLVHNISTFVMASILTGISLGILLGAPLNVLVGVSAQQENQGSALATLSLTRQVGLTLFPTLFAAFITGGFNKIGPAIEQDFSESIPTFNMSDDIDAENYAAVMKEVNGIHSPELQLKLKELVTYMIKTGYNNMFIASAILSFVIIAVGLYLMEKNVKSNEK